MNYSVLAVIEDIKEFVRHCQKDKMLAGFDVLASKHKGRSYLIAKRTNSFKIAYVRQIKLDSLDPYQRSIIFEAMHKAIYGKVNYDLIENEMVCKSEPH